MMSERVDPMEFRRLTTPRAAAVAGILFALLFAASLILIRIAIPENLSAMLTLQYLRESLKR